MDLNHRDDRFTFNTHGNLMLNRRFSAPC